MTEPELPEPLLDVASDVADATPIDWDRRRADAPGLEPALRRLKSIDSIARAFAHAGLEDDVPAAHFPKSPSLPPALFEWGHLRVVRKLGEGSYGEVYEAHDPTLQRQVALKLRRAEAGHARSVALLWLDEARRLARVRHPNVLVVYGADLHDGRTGLWTELISGRTLEEWLEEDGPLGPREAALVGIDLCAALSAVHAAGLVHGDLKTRNVMRAGGRGGESPGTGRIVLMDFGASRDSGDTSGGAVGTPLSSAPEVLRGAAPTPASDIYSLGVLLYRMVSGRYPVESGSVVELADRVSRGDVRPLRSIRPDLPAAFVQAIEKAMAPRSVDRPVDAASMERALAGVLASGAATNDSGVARRRLAWGPLFLLAVAAVLTALVRPWTLFEPGGRTSPGEGPPAADTTPPTVGATGSAEPPEFVALNPAAKAAGASTDQEPQVANNSDEPESSPPRPTPARLPEVAATLFRRDAITDRPLEGGDRVRPGDRLYLDVTAGEAVHVYVLNEDAAGRIHVLFPLSGSELENPLPAGAPQRLPGSREAGRLDWVVTSADGPETFLFLASRNAVAALDSVLRVLPAAREGAPVAYAPLRPEDLAAMRGVGGVSAETIAAVGGGRLMELSRELLRTPRPDPLWIRLLVLENPAY